ncbi:MAG: hypothetical protein AAB581_01990 [Patescibacteria group bacterium]
MKQNAKKREGERMGPVAQKVLILLFAGVTLSLTVRPDHSIRVITSAVREWQRVNQRSLREAVKRLHRLKLIDYQKDKYGVTTPVLSKDGAQVAVRYNLNHLTLSKQARWDGLWRMVLFDIPEPLKKGRNALSLKLKHLGFYQLQKSVFVYPYPCKDEIDYIVEIFGLEPHVRFAVVKELEDDRGIRNRFELC